MIGLAGGMAAVAAVVAAIVVGSMRGCDERSGGDVQSVKLGGEWFHLEVAAKQSVRMKGLGQRTHIEKDGGMLFVFSRPNPGGSGTGFVMRDCPVDIDIVYLSPEGRVATMYEMKAEPARAADGSEGKIGDLGETPASEKYELRLKRYESRYPYQFVIELAGGRLKTLKTPLKEGDKVDLPYESLKRQAE